MVAIKMMEAWGFKINIGSSIGKKDFTFGGTDEERTADLQQFLDDTSVKAIMCVQGAVMELVLPLQDLEAFGKTLE